MHLRWSNIGPALDDLESSSQVVCHGVRMVVRRCLQPDSAHGPKPGSVPCKSRGEREKLRTETSSDVFRYKSEYDDAHVTV